MGYERERTIISTHHDFKIKMFESDYHTLMDLIDQKEKQDKELAELRSEVENMRRMRISVEEPKTKSNGSDIREIGIPISREELSEIVEENERNDDKKKYEYYFTLTREELEEACYAVCESTEGTIYDLINRLIEHPYIIDKDEIERLHRADFLSSYGE